MLRRCVEAVTRVLVLPYAAGYHLLRLAVGTERAYEAISQRAARWPGVYGRHMRRAVVEAMGTRMGARVWIKWGTVLRRPPVTLGDNVAIGQHCVIVSAQIGDNVQIGDHVKIYDGSDQHGLDRLDVPIIYQRGVLRPVRIGDDCLIGAGALILADVGTGCVVGAGAVVLDPVPDYAVVAGVPARQIRDRRAGAPPHEAARAGRDAERPPSG